MPATGLEAKITAILRGMNAAGRYPMALVCTERGLLIASAGEIMHAEAVAGLTSLFDDIVLRARRYLELAAIDEISLSDPKIGRFVVRPLTRDHDPRLFLVVQVPHDRPWRKNTNAAARELLALLRPLLATEP